MKIFLGNFPFSNPKTWMLRNNNKRREGSWMGTLVAYDTRSFFPFNVKKLYMAEKHIYSCTLVEDRSRYYSAMTMSVDHIRLLERQWRASRKKSLCPFPLPPLSAFSHLSFPVSSHFSISVLMCIFICFSIIFDNLTDTEIDWTTYMQQVEMFLNGTRVYTEIKGDTGPLVYPGGHLYSFSLFYFMTKKGMDIRMAQYIFWLVYLVNSVTIVYLHRETRGVPPFVLVISFLTSYRVHSIFILRMFNDALAITMLHLSILLFLSNRWFLGSCLYRSVSVRIPYDVFFLLHS